VLFRQPFVNRRRQKEPGLDRPEVAHRGNTLEKRSKRALILSGSPHGVKSDRLLGAVSPGEFIPIAEDSGLIVSITDWVLEAVAEQVDRWHGEGVLSGRVFMNVSGQQFLRGRLTTRLAELMKEKPHLTGLIGIEITEQAAVRDLKATVQAISELSSISVETAIDDFGTAIHPSATFSSFPSPS
jgi:EAL domain-containing protein (putative c-di-GMP-specific phosphodiesterase class I)